jgi:hypothetical protein
VGWTVQQRKQRERGGMKTVLGIREIVLNVYTLVHHFHRICCNVYFYFRNSQFSAQTTSLHRGEQNHEQYVIKNVEAGLVHPLAIIKRCPLR